MPVPLRVVFAGTTKFAVLHLQCLLHLATENLCQIVCVYTRPDPKSGRGHKKHASAVKQLALQHTIALRQPERLNTPEEIEALRQMQTDLMVVSAYGVLLPANILSLPGLGCINIHPSLLPRWRGAAPVQRAIAAGDRYSGCSIMQMDEGLDTGDVLCQQRCEIGAGECAGQLEERLGRLGAEQLADLLRQFHRGAAPHRVAQQQLGPPCTAARIQRRDAWLRWHESAQDLANLVRALDMRTPDAPAQINRSIPAAWACHNGQRINVWHATAGAGNPGAPPGRIVQCGAAGIEVACGEGTLLLRELQLPGKKPLSAAAIVRGRPQIFVPGSDFATEIPAA